MTKPQKDGRIHGSRCVLLTSLTPSCADCLANWDSQPSGALWACKGPLQGLLYILPFKTEILRNIIHSFPMVKRV